MAASESAFSALESEDWREAFAAHPQIGQRADTHSEDVSRAWSEEEQGGARGASLAAQAELTDLNARYLARFGSIFIVCATDKSAEAMLGLLRERIGNLPDKELAIAREEQCAITRLRLDKLLRV